MVEHLKSLLNKRDEEIRMLRDAYKQHVQAKEEEFKLRWTAQNESETLVHKLNEAEAHATALELEVKRLQEQVNGLTQEVHELKKQSKRQPKKHTGKHSHSRQKHNRVEAKGKKVIALYNFKGTHEGELSFEEGDVIDLIQQINEGWWEGKLANDERGIFPFNYVQPFVISSSESVVHHHDHQQKKQQRAAREKEQEQQEQATTERESSYASATRGTKPTMDRATYAKMKIEEKYKALAKTLVPPPADLAESMELDSTSSDEVHQGVKRA